MDREGEYARGQESFDTLGLCMNGVVEGGDKQ